MPSIGPRQYGLRISFYEQPTCLVDEGKAVDIVYLDFSKAFDTISRITVLEKMASNGLDWYTLQWVKNCLDRQAQKVVMNGVTSNWSLVGFPSAQCQDQSCLTSLSMIWIKGSSASLVTLYQMSRWVSADLLESRKALQRDLDWLG
ncbi:hypothetical protein DUI87_28123 [Hirundo rustica rustica]|uniref:Reverse transcriptase domain-containing protein n=1 Tax=Hirundo rustica rustica TaxID=333673 RepID=A0A3M0J3P0_HIRRU|nr:hypothetical protein DUI87_28123 [Hirundo rustica rustica]